MSSFKPVTALERGLAVLAVVGRLGECTLSQISADTGLDKSTIIRMLETLIRLGYVARHHSQSIYFPTGRTVDLSRGYDGLKRISDTVGPILVDFCARIGWPSDFAVPDKNMMRIVETTGDRSRLLFQRAPNYRPSLLITSLGLAYVSFCSPSRQKELIEALANDPEPEMHEMLTHGDRLHRLMAKVRRQGFAFANRAYGTRLYGGAIRGIAVPVMDDEQIYGAVNVMYVASSLSDRQAAERFAWPLKAVAREIVATVNRAGERLPGSDRYLKTAGTTPIEPRQMRRPASSQ